MKTIGKTLAALTTLGLALGGAGCRGEAPVPDQPTWVDDVLPILRGNCLHCHGSPDVAPDAAKTYRFDLFDLQDPGYKDMHLDQGTGSDLIVTAATSPIGKIPLVELMATFIAKTGPTRMPPSPAARLTVREVEVITKWSQNPLRGVREDNNRPTARVTGTEVHDGKIDVSVVLEDGDEDQVLGLLTYGVASKKMLRSGAHKITFDDAGPQALSAMLSDGQDVVTVPLDMVGTPGVIGPDGGAADSAPPLNATYEADIKPILVAKCATCHTTDGNGGQNIGASYAETQRTSNVCISLKIGECALVRIRQGSMPFGPNCTGDPAKDTAKVRDCLTQLEQDKFAGWIAHGMPEN